MKRFGLKSGLLLMVLLLGAVAWAQQTSVNIDFAPRLMQAGFWVGPKGGLAAANRVSNMLGQSSVIDFAAQTATCVDSSAITVTGALANDPCMVGAPIAAQVANASFTCIVTAADTVKVRFCPTSAGAVDPLSGTFLVRVVSSQ